jgi:hypothetical protein
MGFTRKGECPVLEQPTENPKAARYSDNQEIEP